MSYVTGHNSFTSQYLLNIYIYCRFCRLYIINYEIKKNKKNGNTVDNGASWSSVSKLKIDVVINMTVRML
jgi:hypothetical protein